MHRGAARRARATGTTRSGRPSASVRCPSPAPAWRAPEIAVWSGDTVVADEEGFLYFVGRSDDMIKTSGYRVSPTEVEEVAYETGLVRDAVALGVEDPALGQRIVLVATARSRRSSTPRRCSTVRSAAAARLYMVPSRGRGAARAAAVAQRQVRPRPAPQGGRGMNVDEHHGAASSRDGQLLRRRRAARPARRAGRLHAVLRLRPRSR